MGILDLVKGFIVAILVLGLVTAVPMFMLSNSIKSNLLNPAFYQAQMDKIDGYQKIQSALLDAFMGFVPPEQLRTFGVSSVDLRLALAKSITKDWVKNETTRLTRNLLWYVTGQAQGVNLSISIRPKLTGALGQLAASKLGISPSDAETLIGDSLTSQIPDPFDITTFAPEVKPALAQVKSYIVMFMQLSSVLMFAIIGLLVLILLLRFDIPKFAATVGWPLLIVGAMTAISTFFLPGTVTGFISQAMGSTPPGGITPQMVVEFFQPVFNDILMQSIILIVASAILIAFSFVYPMVTKGDKKK